MKLTEKKDQTLLVFNKHEVASLEKAVAIVRMAREKIKNLDQPLNCLLGDVQWDLTRVLGAHAHTEGVPLQELSDEQPDIK
jgi:hypothetical protein